MISALAVCWSHASIGGCVHAPAVSVALGTPCRWEGTISATITDTKLPDNTGGGLVGCGEVLVLAYPLRGEENEAEGLPAQRESLRP